MQSLAGEISILKQITHPNIVQLLEVVEVCSALVFWIPNQSKPVLV